MVRVTHVLEDLYMDTRTLLELRKKAEKAVADMSDGPLKVKAFEVILASLLTGPQEPVSQAAQKRQDQEQLKEAPAKTLTGRILVLRDEGFFGTQRAISHIREELGAHGWHYPLTTLSGTLQNLARNRKLRRVRATEGKKKVWKYSNF